MVIILATYKASLFQGNKRYSSKKNKFTAVEMAKYTRYDVRIFELRFSCSIKSEQIVTRNDSPLLWLSFY